MISASLNVDAIVASVLLLVAGTVAGLNLSGILAALGGLGGL